MLLLNPNSKILKAAWSLTVHEQALFQQKAFKWISQVLKGAIRFFKWEHLELLIFFGDEAYRTYVLIFIL